jgi:hypothetical protein
LDRFVAEVKHFPLGRIKISCVAKIEDLWQEKVTQVAFGAGDIKTNHLLTSNAAIKGIKFM